MNEAWAVVVGALVAASIGVLSNLISSWQISRQRREDRRREKVKWLQEITVRIIELYGETKVAARAHDEERFMRAYTQFYSWMELIIKSGLGEKMKSIPELRDESHQNIERLMDSAVIALSEAIEQAIAGKD